MIGFKIDQAKGLFFDSEAVKKQTTRKERRVLSRFGAFVRRSARDSIRKRRRVSDPDDPPSSHNGLLKRFIFFVFDILSHSVVIGPTLINRGDGTAPEALEAGGEFPRVNKRGKPYLAHYRARPYMGPAFQKNLPKVPEMWEDSIR